MPSTQSLLRLLLCDLVHLLVCLHELRLHLVDTVSIEIVPLRLHLVVRRPAEVFKRPLETVRIPREQLSNGAAPEVLRLIFQYHRVDGIARQQVRVDMIHRLGPMLFDERLRARKRAPVPLLHQSAVLHERIRLAALQSGPREILGRRMLVIIRRRCHQLPRVQHIDDLLGPTRPHSPPRALASFADRRRAIRRLVL